MRNAMLFVLVFLTVTGFAKIVNAKTTIVKGGVIHFRGEIVEDPCDFTFLNGKSKIVEKCGIKDSVTYDLDRTEGIKNYVSSVVKIQYQSLTENLSMVSVIYQ